jgi:hypothetical protein
MYLRILEGFPSHWKTLALARKLDDHNAGMYCLRLWTWACQSAPSGDLSNIDPLDIELIVHWPGEPGRCFAAMVAVRLIDRREDGGHEIHEWADHTGGDIEKMEVRAAEKRADAAERKRRERERKAAGEVGHTGHAPVTRDIGVTVTPCHDPRQGKTRQDETRQNPSATPARAGDPTATAATSGPVALALAVAAQVEQAGELVASGAPLALVRGGPPTGYDVVQLYARVRGDCLNVPGWATPGGQALQKADRFVAGLHPEATALLEPSMRLFFEQVQDHTARPPPDPRLLETGFGFGGWLHRFPDLCEQLLGARRPAQVMNPRDAAFLRSVQGEA